MKRMGGVFADTIWRVRTAAWLLAGLLCATFCVLLWLASRGTVLTRDDAASVETFIEARDIERRPRPERAQANASRGARAAAPPVQTSNVEAQMLRRMLSCVARPGQRRPEHCPREPAPEDWRSPELAVGGSYARAPEFDLNEVYTSAEMRTLVMPSCARDGVPGVGGCVRVGVTPPPPSRSAEEVCEAERLGGPCRPPPDPTE